MDFESGFDLILALVAESCMVNTKQMVNYQDFMMIISLHSFPHYNLIDLLLYYLTFGYLSIHHHVFPFALFIL